MAWSGAYPSKSGTPWASPLGVVRSFELLGTHRPTSPTKFVGTTPPSQGIEGSSKQWRDHGNPHGQGNGWWSLEGSIG